MEINYTAQNVAQIFGVSIHTVLYWRKRGTLVGQHLGGPVYRYPVEAVEAFAKAHPRYLPRWRRYLADLALVLRDMTPPNPRNPAPFTKPHHQGPTHDFLRPRTSDPDPASAAGAAGH